MSDLLLELQHYFMHNMCMFMPCVDLETRLALDPNISHHLPMQELLASPLTALSLHL